MRTYYPQIINFKNKNEFEAFKKKNHINSIFDFYSDLIFEHFLVANPSVYFVSKDVQKKEFHKSFLSTKQGCWVYHEWSNQLVHLIDQQKYLDLRTARNRNLINKYEQMKIYNKTIGIAGLSVGSNITLSLLRYGISNYYKIADSDKVALSNINRAFYTLYDLEKNKTDVIRERMHEIDPFVKIDSYSEGLTEKNSYQFLRGVNLIIDAFDNFDLKIKLRKMARIKKVPVISGFDIDKSILITVERYDIDPKLDIHLFLNNISEETIYKQFSSIQQKNNLFIDIIGRKYHSRKMLQSVLNVGKTLTGYPQLIVATLLLSASLVYVTERILLGKPLSSFKKHISLEYLFS
ncbi:ThiF family adenylyltransferase [Candidatus Roizmanbacteria bacterium]|nr:ThiF family adenylyltransferase [Candidatus Roizmanbacteria bacterium]